MKEKNIAFFTSLIIIFSIICGIISQDYFLGTTILISGLLNCYYASISKIYNYFWGAIYCLLSGYVCYVNHLYGIAILSFLVYVPSQIQGYFSWQKNIHNKVVPIRGFNFKNSLLITTICILGSFFLAYILNKIPNQQLAFWDASSNIINLCGIILMNLRYKECWIIWLFNNSIDLYIWIVNFLKGSPNSFMMVLVSLGYLIINIYGLIKWIRLRKKNLICE